MYVTIHRTQNVKVHYQQLVLSTLYEPAGQSPAGTLHEPAGQSPAGQVSGVHRLTLMLTDIVCTSLPVSHPLAS